MVDVRNNNQDSDDRSFKRPAGRREELEEEAEKFKRKDVGAMEKDLSRVREERAERERQRIAGIDIRREEPTRQDTEKTEAETENKVPEVKKPEPEPKPERPVHRESISSERFQRINEETGSMAERLAPQKTPRPRFSDLQDADPPTKKPARNAQKKGSLSVVKITLAMLALIIFGSLAYWFLFIPGSEAEPNKCNCELDESMLSKECRDFCYEPVCGNGILDPEEECDDGNTENNDGCDSNCLAENKEPADPSDQTPIEPEKPISLIDNIAAEEIIEIDKLYKIPEELAELMSKQYNNIGFIRVVFKKDGQYLGLASFLQSFGATFPEDILNKLNNDATFFISAENNTNRFGFVAKTEGSGVAGMFRDWEPEIQEDTKPIFLTLGQTEPAYRPTFQNYQFSGINFRYLTISTQDFGICYTLVNDHLIFTTSNHSTEKLIGLFK